MTDASSVPPSSRPSRSLDAGTIAAIGAIFILVAVIVGLTRQNLSPERANPAPLVPDFSIPTSQVRAPLPYRIVSFHRGRADKNLIKLAAQLGFNGVQFQIEGSNDAGIADFAARDAKEHLVDYCHSLGMKVTVWVHELSDLPGPWMPEYLGPEKADNDRLFAYLGQRYEWILGKEIPNVDGLALTVVETQIRATEPAMLLRLCELISGKCKEHGKSFMLRTFVWHPYELAGVMAAVKKLPPDAVIMSKCVPQDWQMRGANSAEIGAVGDRPQIVEFDAAGEYFLRNTGANCMPALLKKQLDYEMSKGVQGICVRVDRYDDSVLFQPTEVNLWALGMLASGASDNLDDIWMHWATQRYGAAAAAGVIRALKPTGEVMAELLSVGPFTFGDTRKLPPLPDEDFLGQNWQNWQWDSSYLPAYEQAKRGDAGFIAQVTAQKAAAMKLADQCLADLEQVRPLLPEREWEILLTRLYANKMQLAYRTPMVLATLEYQAAEYARTDAEKQAHLEAARGHVEELWEVVSPQAPLAMAVDYLGRQWLLGQGAAGIDRNVLLYWCYDTKRLLDGQRSPLPTPVERAPDPLHP